MAAIDLSMASAFVSVFSRVLVCFHQVDVTSSENYCGGWSETHSITGGRKGGIFLHPRPLVPTSLHVTFPSESDFVDFVLPPPFLANS